MSLPYDAILIVSFGGPEKNEDVIPFLENVLRGKPVPRERMLEVAEHYYHFGGKSPINEHARELIDALRTELKTASIDLPVYWGNRNWHPMLPDTLEEMKEQGIKKALAFFISGYSCYSGCRQYRENIIEARETVGEAAPVVDKIRVFYNHPLFIEANVEKIRHSLNQFSPEEQQNLHLSFTAHSIPMGMAETSDYEQQLLETARLIAEELQIPEDRYQLVYQSRSGRPQDPWLEPDILDHIEELHQKGCKNLIISPIGFLSDHMEIMFDLDTEALEKCNKLEIKMERAKTVGNHPRFITMIRELIEERLELRTDKRAIGKFGPNHDVCPVNCCPAPKRPTRPQPASN